MQRIEDLIQVLQIFRRDHQGGPAGASAAKHPYMIKLPEIKWKSQLLSDIARIEHVAEQQVSAQLYSLITEMNTVADGKQKINNGVTSDH